MGLHKLFKMVFFRQTEVEVIHIIHRVFHRKRPKTAL